MRKIYLLISILLAIIFGWILGTLKLPDFDINNQFFFGIVSGLVSLFLAFMLLVLLKQNFFLKRDRSNSSNWVKLIPWFVVILITIAAIYQSLNNKQDNALIELQENKYRQQKIKNVLIDSKRKSEFYNNRMRKLIMDVRAQTDLITFEKLSDELIDQFISLSNYLEPYAVLSDDSLSAQKYSPERGEIIEILRAFEIDSASFDNIIRKGNFEKADLRGADLEGVNLSGINLAGADLSRANLKNANLIGCTLINANFQEAQLDRAILDKSDIKNANFNWASLKGSSLKNTNLKGADLSNATMNGADLQDAFMQWAIMNGTHLKEANLFGADLFSVKFEKANFQGANLKWSRIRSADFTDADLTNVNLLNAAPGADWLDKLLEWRMLGTNEINVTYQLVEDSIQRFSKEKYLLKPVYKTKSPN